MSILQFLRNFIGEKIEIAICQADSNNLKIYIDLVNECIPLKVLKNRSSDTCYICDSMEVTLNRVFFKASIQICLATDIYLCCEFSSIFWEYYANSSHNSVRYTHRIFFC